MMRTLFIIIVTSLLSSSVLLAEEKRPDKFAVELFNNLEVSDFNKNRRPDEFPVESYNNLAVRDFNSEIYLALRRGEAWVFNPLFVVQQYQKNFNGGFASIRAVCNREYSTHCTVTWVESGYLDDSVRGQWFQFHLERRDHNSEVWTIQEIRQAYVCGRINSRDIFSRNSCP